MKYTKHFEEISMHETALVGGKGASLGELTKRGIPVPAGFVVTTDAHSHYRVFHTLPDGLEEELTICLRNLRASFFAVRSSATVEDSSAASWAGQFESYLHVSPQDVMRAVEKCWHSAHSARVASYSRRQQMPHAKISLAVVVQEMVPSLVSGVCFTVNPLGSRPDELLIEAIYGLGQPLVEGTVAPDMYAVDAQSFEILEKHISTQETQRMSVDGTEQEMKVEESTQQMQKLSDQRIIEISALTKKIEDHYGKPQDIEWTFDGEQFFILQSRPITTL